VYVDEGTLEMSGGEIFGNTAELQGGGVYVADATVGKFQKTGGIVRGSNENTNIQNTAISGYYSAISGTYSKYGHAVCVCIDPDGTTAAAFRTRDNTAGTGDNIDSGKTGWED
jgi:hypothetical protein